jgi:hypothetical protein
LVAWLISRGSRSPFGLDIRFMSTIQPAGLPG